MARIKTAPAIAPTTMPASAPVESLLEVPVLLPLVLVGVGAVDTVDEEYSELIEVAEVPRTEVVGM